MLLSLSLVVCGQKNNSEGKEDSSKSNNSISTTQNSEGDSINTTYSTVENLEDNNYKYYPLSYDDHDWAL